VYARLTGEITAELFIKRGGFDTKEKLIDWACNNACMTAGEYWDYQLIQNYVYPRATCGEEPYASMLATPADELVYMFQQFLSTSGGKPAILM
jgi:hypothetical protein